MDRVYVTRALPDALLAPIAARHEMGVWQGDGPVPGDLLASEAEQADGLLCMLTDAIDVQLLERAVRLRVVSQMAVGVDNIDIAECTRRGIVVGHTPGVLTETVADSAFALLAAVVRRLPEGEKVARAGEWGPWDPFFLAGGDLHGSTLGIVGMGRIGEAVARRASGFGMTILYSAPRPAQTVDGDHVPLERLLAESDHIVICASLTEETHGLIGTKELALMSSTSYLVNVARGPIVDTDALVVALESGAIAGAGLDVTDPEPLPPAHRLLTLPNCLVVPHIASASVRTRSAMASLAVDNLVAGLAGEDLPAAFPPGG